MTTSSSSAAEKKTSLSILITVITILIISILTFVIVFFSRNINNEYILKTLDLNGSAERGDSLFKMNCVGCHGITARGLVGPDLHTVTSRLNDSEIINQVIEGLTPPMPSFEIEPQNMSDLLSYLHTLN